MDKHIDSMVETIKEQEQKIKKMEFALRKISKWEGEFPETGEYWDKEKTRPMKYGSCYGSNEERDFMREIARKALAL